MNKQEKFNAISEEIEITTGEMSTCADFLIEYFHEPFSRSYTDYVLRYIRLLVHFDYLHHELMKIVE